jgi:hypothetical protein
VAFYCRVNHRDRDYEKYLADVMKRLEEKYGKQKWDLQIFFEEASGAAPDRKEFIRLKAEITAGKIDVVVTMKASTIARAEVEDGSVLQSVNRPRRTVIKL